MSVRWDFSDLIERSNEVDEVLRSLGVSATDANRLSMGYVNTLSLMRSRAITLGFSKGRLPPDVIVEPLTRHRLETKVIREGKEFGRIWLLQLEPPTTFRFESMHGVGDVTLDDIA
jgi:hypothetical protein